jgi:hypothetical protein
VGGDEQWVETGEEDETTSTRDRRRQARNDETGKRERVGMLLCFRVIQLKQHFFWTDIKH